MATERRSRITLLLPAPENPAEFIVLDEVLTELTRSCGGATASQITPTVFNGWWIDDGRVHPDANILVISDSPLPHSDATLLAYLDSLKVRCQREFQESIVWITVHEVTRIATDDYVR